MRVKFKKCAAAVFAALLFVVCAARDRAGGAASNNIGGAGYVRPPMDLSYLSKNPPRNVTKRARSVSIPSKYDMRNTGRLTPVRDQGQYGTCWAYAAVSACESNYLTRSKSGNFSGSLGNASSLNLSEMYVAWFAYRDEKAKSFTATKSNVLNQGGNEWESTAVLARAGLVTEASMPYGKIPSRSARPESYPRVLRIKEATFAALEHGSPEQNRIVKKLIMDKGAVLIAYYDDDSYYDRRHNSYFRKGKTDPNHMITIVGWDDNYSRKNFGRDKPSRDGAWLARNSFGPKWASGGYFWISYEQHHRSGTAYTVEPVREKVRHYGYDDLGWINSIWLSDAKGNSARKRTGWAASVFQVRGNGESLNEVGFYTTDNGTKYTVSVYCYGEKRPSESTLLSGSPAATKSGTMDLAGYHTVKLPNIVQLKKGEWFSVVVKLTNPSFEAPLAVEQREKGYTDNCVVGAGESYFSDEGKKWIDGKNMKLVGLDPANACIKAFTLCGKGSEPEPEPKPFDDDDDWEEEWDEEEYDDFNDDYDDDYDEDWDDNEEDSDEDWKEDWDDDEDEEEDDEDEDWDDDDKDKGKDKNGNINTDDYDIGIILIPKRK